MSKLKAGMSLTDLDEGWANVDAWHCPGIISASKAHEAEKRVSELGGKLSSETKNHASLAESAKSLMEEMASLLKMVELSTASKKEIDRIKMIDEEMKLLKEDVTASTSAIKSYTEELLESKAKTYALMKTVKDRDISSVMKFVREAETVDLAFLLDCTGSMSSYISAAKNSMKDIVTRVKRTNAGLNLRIAVVGYRDLCDGYKRFQVMQFTEAVAEFEALFRH